MADDTFGSGLNFGGGAGTENSGADVPPTAPVSPLQAPQQAPQSFGSLFGGPSSSYKAPDPSASPLDQTADTLQQRIQRANSIATNPMLQLFNPEAVQKARDFVPAATEQLQKIKGQKADMTANRQQAATLGLDPGEVPDEASMGDRVEAAKARALKGDLKVFKGLQAVDPKTAEAIQDQVHEAASSHLGNAQLAYDSLSAVPNQGQYAAKLSQLRKDGTLTDLEALGVKIPDNFDAFNASKAREGQALREARIGMDSIKQKLEDRNTYQPMEDKEAKTYNGRMTTVYGDQITNGTWSRNGASNTRGLVVNGAADPRDLQKNFTLGSDEQRKSMREEGAVAVPKEDVEKNRAFSRTYKLATEDAKGNKVADGAVNTNPNVQQGMAEGLASMLRGGSGGANVGLLKIELAKRGWAQGAIDGLISNYSGALNTMFQNEKKPYLSTTTQKQIRDVMDVLKTYNDSAVGDRLHGTALRAGALGFDSSVFGFGKGENSAVDNAIEEGRRNQIARMSPQHQAIGGGDGVFQLGAQRPGAGATALPPGTQNANQQPGAQPLLTPVQQASQPPASTPPAVPPQNGPTSPTAAPSQQGPNGPQPGGGGSPSPQSYTIAGQPVSLTTPQGVSPNFVPAMQRIESGNEKTPWTAGAGNGPDGRPLTSASGAFQFTDQTWAENKPAGAPNKAGAATPAQQATGLANLMQKNANSLSAAGVPVNDVNMYVAHNLGPGGATALLKADPNADARTVVGERAARNNPLFFKGRPTVAQALARYNAEMQGPAEPDQPKPGAGGATADQPGFWSRLNSVLMQGVPQDQRAKAAADVGNAAVNNAPAIGSTVGGIAGGVAGPVGAVAGGAAGGGAGQSFKDYMQGNPQNPTEIAKQTALGGVLGVTSEARPVLSAGARVVGAGAVEGGSTLAAGGDAEDATEAALKGAGEAGLGEGFGRALGMVGHKIFTMFSPDAKKTIQAAAKKYADADDVLKVEEPKIAGAAGTAASPNPKYDAAEKAKEEAETVLKDANLKPEEAAYAHRVSSEPVTSRPSVQEAQLARPGAVEKASIGAGYQQLESEVGAAGKGAPKAAPKLVDGPIAAVESDKVSKAHAEIAQRTEMAITAPAANWQEKWNQLKDARSGLLDAERDAMSSTESGRTQTAKDMRTLADTVRKQQEKVANYVFGPKDGPAFMDRLKTLDVRYRNLMDATGGDVAKAVTLKGEAGRNADKAFRAFAMGDKTALAAWDAMRGTQSNVEKDVRTLVGADHIPILGKVISGAKLIQGWREFMRERAAGSPATFADLVPELKDMQTRGRTAAGTMTAQTVQRGTLQGGQ